MPNATMTSGNGRGYYVPRFSVRPATAVSEPPVVLSGGAEEGSLLDLPSLSGDVVPLPVEYEEKPAHPSAHQIEWIEYLVVAGLVMLITLVLAF